MNCPLKRQKECLRLLKDEGKLIAYYFHWNKLERPTFGPVGLDNFEEISIQLQNSYVQQVFSNSNQAAIYTDRIKCAYTAAKWAAILLERNMFPINGINSYRNKEVFLRKRFVDTVKYCDCIRTHS
jgi:hypothetical protein